MLSDSLQTKFLAAVVESKTRLCRFRQLSCIGSRQFSIEFWYQRDILPVPGTQTQMVDFAATVEGLNIHYLYYVTENDNNYVQLYGWTLASLFDSSKMN